MTWHNFLIPTFHHVHIPSLWPGADTAPLAISFLICKKKGAWQDDLKIPLNFDISYFYEYTTYTASPEYCELCKF